MNTLTQKIPQVLDRALQFSSARRQMSKSAGVREALEKTLATELSQVSPAAAWVTKWCGKMADAALAMQGDDWLAPLLQKHLR